MDVKVVTYSGKYTYDDYLEHINSILSTIAGANVDEAFNYKCATLLCLDMVHLMLFKSGLPLVKGKQYSLHELVVNIPGMFSNSMFEMLSNLSNIGMQTNIRESLEGLLKDSLSYELYQCLGVTNRVHCLFVLFYESMLSTEYTPNKECAYKYLRSGKELNTLDWSVLYNLYN